MTTGQGTHDRTPQDRRIPPGGWVARLRLDRFPFGVAGAAALLLGLLLRLWFMHHEARISGDSLVYGDFAGSLIRQHVYGFSRVTVTGLSAPSKATLIRLPGYPLFLAASFLIFGMEKYMAVLRLQIAIDLWSCLLIAGIARRLFGRRAGVAALWLAALCPFTASYIADPLTETLTLFCIALAFYALLRWSETGRGFNRWFYCLAFALAYAILLRPEQGMLAAAILPAVLWLGRTDRRWNLRRALALALLTVLPLVPWTVRNWRVFHVIQPLAPRYAVDPGYGNPYGFDRWFRTWAIDFASTANVYWDYDGDSILIGDLPNRAFDSPAQYAETKALLADYANILAITPALDARFDALGRERIRGHALRYYVMLPTARVLDMAFRPRLDLLQVPYDWWKWRDHPGASMFSIAYALLNLFYFFLAGITLSRRRQWRPYAPFVWSMLATIVMRALLLMTLDNAETRYTIEFFPVLIVLAAACFTDSGFVAEDRLDR